MDVGRGSPSFIETRIAQTEPPDAKVIGRHWSASLRLMAFLWYLLWVISKLYAEHVRALQTRYESVLSKHGLDAIVIHSGTPKKRTEFDDQFFNLRPTPHFQHWIALEEPDCFVIVRAGHKPELIWPVVESFWERPRTLDLGYTEGAFTVKRPRGELSPEPLPGRSAFVGEHTAKAAAWGIAHVNPEALMADLDELRVHKTDYELTCLREANAVAARGHRAVLEAFRQGLHSELELHLIYLRETQQDDPDTPYKNIVALDHNAATLHHISYGRDKVDARVLLLDAGATVRGYCSDITRTWVKGSGATVDVFRQMVDGLEQSQKRLCAKACDGMLYEELHEEAHRDVSQILHDTGVSSLSAAEIDATGISRTFLPHGLGHSLGLQCHDVGCALVKAKPKNKALRHTRNIEERQCFTIEPGIYFIEGLLAELRGKPEAASIHWPLVDSLRGFGGIRIEDDLHVQDGVPVNMTRPLLPLGGGAV
jgi:Xaa-Pro dipeptidase